MSNDGDVVSARPAQRTTIASLLLYIGDDSSFRDLADREDVADGERGVLAGVDELAGVHALVGDEGLVVQFEAVGIAEGDFGKWRASPWVVDDLLHHAAQVAVAFGIVEGSEFGGGFVELCGCVLVYARS